MTAAGALTALSGLAGAGAAGTGTGLRAALLWLRASKVRAMPDWNRDDFGATGVTKFQLGWLAGLIVAGHEGGTLNASAARWTAAAAILAAAQSAAGFLASAFA